MFIHEAINARTADKPCITREARKILNSSVSLEGIRLLPTNTPDCCILSATAEKSPAVGGSPGLGIWLLMIG